MACTTNRAPAKNRLMEERWEAYCQAIHLDKLVNIKPEIVTVRETDKTVPAAKAEHSKKRELLREERNRIQRDNETLLKKILALDRNTKSKIRSRKKKKGERIKSVKERMQKASERGDNAEYHILLKHIDNASMSSTVHQIHSNRIAARTGKMKREQEKIDRENERIMKRLLSAKATISSKRLDDEARKRKKLVKNISEFSNRKVLDLSHLTLQAVQNGQSPLQKISGLGSFPAAPSFPKSFRERNGGVAQRRKLRSAGEKAYSSHSYNPKNDSSAEDSSLSDESESEESDSSNEVESDHDSKLDILNKESLICLLGSGELADHIEDFEGFSLFEKMGSTVSVDNTSSFSSSQWDIKGFEESENAVQADLPGLLDEQVTDAENGNEMDGNTTAAKLLGPENEQVEMEGTACFHDKDASQLVMESSIQDEQKGSCTDSTKVESSSTSEYQDASHFATQSDGQSTEVAEPILPTEIVARDSEEQQTSQVNELNFDKGTGASEPNSGNTEQLSQTDSKDVEPSSISENQEASYFVTQSNSQNTEVAEPIVTAEIDGTSSEDPETSQLNVANFNEGIEASVPNFGNTEKLSQSSDQFMESNLEPCNVAVSRESLEVAQMTSSNPNSFSQLDSTGAITQSDEKGILSTERGETAMKESTSVLTPVPKSVIATESNPDQVSSSKQEHVVDSTDEMSQDDAEISEKMSSTDTKPNASDDIHVDECSSEVAVSVVDFDHNNKDAVKTATAVNDIMETTSETETMRGDFNRQGSSNAFTPLQSNSIQIKEIKCTMQENKYQVDKEIKSDNAEACQSNAQEMKTVTDQIDPNDSRDNKNDAETCVVDETDSQLGRRHSSLIDSDVASVYAVEDTDNFGVSRKPVNHDSHQGTKPLNGSETANRGSNAELASATKKEEVDSPPAIEDSDFDIPVLHIFESEPGAGPRRKSVLTPNIPDSLVRANSVKNVSIESSENMGVQTSDIPHLSDFESTGSKKKVFTPPFLGENLKKGSSRNGQWEEDEIIHRKSSEKDLDTLDGVVRRSSWKGSNSRNSRRGLMPPALSSDIPSHSSPVEVADESSLDQLDGISQRRSFKENRPSRKGLVSTTAMGEEGIDISEEEERKNLFLAMNAPKDDAEDDEKSSIWASHKVDELCDVEIERRMTGSEKPTPPTRPGTLLPHNKTRSKSFKFASNDRQDSSVLMINPNASKNLLSFSFKEDDSVDKTESGTPSASQTTTPNSSSKSATGASQRKEKEEPKESKQQPAESAFLLTSLGANREIEEDIGKDTPMPAHNSFNEPGTPGSSTAAPPTLLRRNSLHGSSFSNLNAWKNSTTAQIAPPSTTNSTSMPKPDLSSGKMVSQSFKVSSFQSGESSFKSTFLLGDENDGLLKDLPEDEELEAMITYKNPYEKPYSPPGAKSFKLRGKQQSFKVSANPSQSFKMPKNGGANLLSKAAERSGQSFKIKKNDGTNLLQSPPSEANAKSSAEPKDIVVSSDSSKPIDTKPPSLKPKEETLPADSKKQQHQARKAAAARRRPKQVVQEDTGNSFDNYVRNQLARNKH